MISPDKNSLMQIFNDPTYAWQLLEWEIAIEMNQALSGQAIARLLELYMRGVQKMNSLMDVRESYFKNKVTSLMMKNSVVKTLNKPPMSKKQKPLEVQADQFKPTAKTNGSSSRKKSQKDKANEANVPKVNPLALNQKRKEMEMRLAYQADSTSRENINKLYDQHIKKQQKYISKVKNIINDHQARLKERIMKRKLKTSTYRSRPEDTSDTFPFDETKFQKSDQPFSPRGQRKKMQEQGQQKNKSNRPKSLQIKAKHDLSIEDSPRKQRKYTSELKKDSLQQIEEKKKDEIEQLKDFKKYLQKGKNQNKTEIELVIKQENDEDSVDENKEIEQVIENRQSI